MSKKLRLGSNFPRAALNSRKNEVRIELIEPKTAISIISCKLDVDNIRAKTKICTIIRTQEELVSIECGRYWKGTETFTDKTTTWIEEASMKLSEDI